jgi:acyl dehydratase
MRERYFEDFTVGDRFATAAAALSDGMITEFARTYDPQPFHVDPEAARRTIFGGLIASGFQTLAFGFRLVWDTGVFHGGSMGSPGFDELRWLRPVRPGDALHVACEVVETTPSRSKPDRGLIRVAYRYLNQDGEPVLTFTSMHLFRRRPAAA